MLEPIPPAIIPDRDFHELCPNVQKLLLKFGNDVERMYVLYLLDRALDLGEQRETIILSIKMFAKLAEQETKSS